MTEATIDSSAALPGAAEPATGGRLAAFLERWANPVLVKEIRQAQRGKVFPIALIVTLSLAMLAAATVAIGVDASEMSRPGPAFFSGAYFFLCVAVLLIVPFQAFVAMGAEWDDNTFEMLVLSNLSPRQIVYGKMLAAFLQSLLFVACFAPFMAVAFLLRGVDAAMMLLILGLTILASGWLITVSVMLSTLVRKRFLRVLLMVMVAGGLMLLLPGSSALASEFIRRPDLIAEPQFLIGMAQFVLAAVLVGIVAYFMACSLLAHEEENRSTPLRVLTSVIVLFTFGVLTFNVLSPLVFFPRQGIFSVTIAAIFFVGFLSVFFGYEPERLGRRVLPSVPRSSKLALFAAPWLPGGGLGALFLLLHLGVLTVGSIALSVLLSALGQYPAGSSGMLSSSRGGAFSEGAGAMVTAALYVMLYVLLSMGVLSRFGRHSVARNILRALTIATPLIYLFLPALLGLFIGDRSLTRMIHIGNPVVLMEDAWDNDFEEYGHYLGILILAAGLGVGLNAPRIFAGLGGVRRASEARRQQSVEPAGGDEAPGAAHG